MRTSLINCDIELTGALRMLCLDAGIKPVCFYWNGSIPSEVVLTVEGSSKAFLGATPAKAIAAAEAALYGGL